MSGTNPMLSVIGLYNWDNNLFAKMWVPQQLNKPVLINNLLMELGELQVIYPDPDFMKTAIEQWSFTKVLQWQRIFDAMQKNYDPLYNKDAHYEETETRDLHSTGGSESVGQVSAYNADDFVNREKGTAEAESADTGTITRERREYGNIGITTSQQMLREEVELWNELNMMNIIISDFKYRFCVMVY